MKSFKPQHLGLGLIGLGFVFILLAWNGAAKVSFVDGQIPYLISGGFAGLSMVVLGGGLLLFVAITRQSAHLEAKFDELIEVMRASAAPGAAASPTPVARAVTKAKPATNGLVVVGRSSFHCPDCRLVEGKEDADLATPDEAAERGLSPCRVCAPTRPAARR